MTDDESAIRALVDTWIKASKAGDMATVLNLMTDDVVFMVPGREPFSKDVYAASSQSPHPNLVEGKSDIQEIRVLGDWAYIRNHLEMIITAPNNLPVKKSGYTLSIFRKEPDGKWRLARDANLLT